MTQNTITLIVLAVLVVFSLPALYRKKKSGDLTLWGKGRNILGQLPSEEAACAAVSSSSRNGSQKDILQFVSSLMKLVRKNHWYIVMPGQLSDGKTKTNLSLVLITQHRVIGLKCYGYGGALTNNGKAADWTQKLDKTTKAIHSPLPDQTAQQAALASLLPQLNASQVEVFSVFYHTGRAADQLQRPELLHFRFPAGKAAKLFRGLRRPSSAEGAGHCTGSHEAGPARQKQTITTSHMCGCRTRQKHPHGFSISAVRVFLFCFLL
mgnify:CR=1 FL=1